MTALERRYLDSEVEVRQATGKRLRIGGYATVFIPHESKNLGGFIERCSPYAFDEVRNSGWRNLDGSGVACRYNHDSNMLLGTSEAGTLRVGTDDHGLHYEVDVPQTRRDVYELVERGDIRYSSFAFRCLPNGDDWTVDQRNFPIRTLNALELIDVAPVLSPGYPDATAALRSLDAWRSDGRLPAGRPSTEQRLVEHRAEPASWAAVIALEHRAHRMRLEETHPAGSRELDDRVALELLDRRFPDAP